MNWFDIKCYFYCFLVNVMVYLNGMQCEMIYLWDDSFNVVDENLIEGYIEDEFSNLIIIFEE